MPSNETYLRGEVSRISILVADIEGLAADPGGLVLKLKPPSGALITHTFGAGNVIVRDSQGNYHADIPLSLDGTWVYRWELSTPNAGAAEGVITVQKSRVI